MFKTTSRTYYQWIEILEASGGVKIEIKRTRRGKIDPDALKKAVEEKPAAYLRELSKMFGCSPSSVYRRLVSLGFTYKKTFTCPEKSEEARAEFREKPALIPEETRACIDESGINKPLVRERGRSPEGVKTGDVKSGGKFQRTKVIAALICRHCSP